MIVNFFSASLVPHPTPAQRLRFGRSIADIVRFTKSFTYLLTYLLKWPGDAVWVQEQEMQKQKLLFEQSRLCSRGAAEMALMYISSSNGQLTYSYCTLSRTCQACRFQF